MLFSVFYVTVNVHSKDNIVSNCTEERGDCERVLSALLLESTKNTLAFTTGEELQMWCLLQVQIEGTVISDAASMGMKYQFVMHGDTDSVTLCAVEEFVLEHYKHNNYPEGKL